MSIWDRILGKDSALEVKRGMNGPATAWPRQFSGPLGLIPNLRRGRGVVPLPANPVRRQPGGAEMLRESRSWKWFAQILLLAAAAGRIHYRYCTEIEAPPQNRQAAHAAELS
ncbi:hypothetical protein [Dongia sp.]|uniref:hypothetical protein n=1 Tax=Dongia sp. TaxID=1977262 RepID=UPI0037526978